MQPSRRKFLQSAAAAIALPASASKGWTQTYPSRPVRLIVGFAAGGAFDISARLIAQWLSERLAQPFIVENRPGAGGNIATEAVARAPSDGYTLLLVGPPNVINVTLYQKLSFDFLRDIAPVASINRDPSVMLVHPSFPAKTVSEFIAYAKAIPGKINMASAEIGTAGHLAGELFKMMTGTNIVHIPYRGGVPALTDLIGGQVQVMFGNLPTSIEHIRSGRLRAVAVTTARHVEAMPEVPTLGDFVPGYEASSVFGVGAPRGTPVEVIETLNKEITLGLANPRVRAQIAALGSTPLTLSPADFRHLLVDETEKWAKVVKFS